MKPERCEVCGAPALAYIGESSLCARCGLERMQDPGRPKRRRTLRAATVGLFSSGLFVKMALGAVALAAVGGMAMSGDTGPGDLPGDVQVLSATLHSDEGGTEGVEDVDAGESSDSVLEEPAGDSGTEEITPEVEEAMGMAAEAHELAAAMQEWADCVKSAAREHSGGAFNPLEACPDKPKPADFGLGGSDDEITEEPVAEVEEDADGPGGSESAPGHDVSGPGGSENAPGQGAETVPGQDVAGPGESENAPGHDADGPGNSENAPGHDPVEPTTPSGDE